MGREHVALALVSGGLDSTLAVRTLQEQGITVKALTFVSVFSHGRSPEGELAARVSMDRLGVELHVRESTTEMLRFVPSPRFGWGKHLNPCQDCRSYYLSVAKTMLEPLGASYVVTGEVLGQRPMSQHREALKRIEKAAGLERMVVRPLTALALEPTIPEERGWIDRGKLLGISGRSRSEQDVLTRRWNVTGYTPPAGGCLLTDAQFAWRLEDLLNWEELSALDAHLLKYGRHFRLDAETRTIVGRDERENAKLLTFRRTGDWVLVAAAGSSPETLLHGNASEKNLETAARLTARYSAHRRMPEVDVIACPADATMDDEDGASVVKSQTVLRVAPARDADIEALAIRRPVKRSAK
jgi:tRNA U34 2-thiouridine synthase MnmA/TrmU